MSCIQSLHEGYISRSMTTINYIMVYICYLLSKGLIIFTNIKKHYKYIVKLITSAKVWKFPRL